VAGTGSVRLAIDGDERELEVAAPGLVDLAVGDRHGEHRLVLAPDPSVEVYSLSFSAGPP
jgi:hypothetical protein